MTVVFGVGTRLISEDFATELVRVILPTVLGSATTIVGVLFVNERKQRYRRPTERSPLLAAGRKEASRSR